MALAVCLDRKDDAAFVDHAAWHARILIGATFTAAVAWKLYFGEFVTGVALWMFMLADGRFGPVARMVGLSDAAIEQGRAGLTELLAGTHGTVSVEAPSALMWRIAAVAVVALLLEAIVAVSHLAPDSSRLAAVRLPSIVLFTVVTYAVVPVFLFAALLALLALTTARWRPEAMWIVPVMVMVSVVRLALTAI